MTEFEAAMMKIKGIKDIHDIHIWSISVGKPAMTAHITCAKGK